MASAAAEPLERDRLQRHDEVKRALLEQRRKGHARVLKLFFNRKAADDGRERRRRVHELQLGDPVAAEPLGVGVVVGVGVFVGGGGGHITPHGAHPPRGEREQLRRALSLVDLPLLQKFEMLLREFYGDQPERWPVQPNSLEAQYKSYRDSEKSTLD